jgi:hypothetical protein
VPPPWSRWSLQDACDWHFVLLLMLMLRVFGSLLTDPVPPANPIAHAAAAGATAACIRQQGRRAAQLGCISIMLPIALSCCSRVSRQICLCTAENLITCWLWPCPQAAAAHEGCMARLLRGHLLAGRPAALRHLTAARKHAADFAALLLQKLPQAEPAPLTGGRRPSPSCHAWRPLLCLMCMLARCDNGGVAKIGAAGSDAVHTRVPNSEAPAAVAAAVEQAPVCGQAGLCREDRCSVAAARRLESGEFTAVCLAEVTCQLAGVAPRRERAGDRARAAAASLQGRLSADSFQRAVQQAEHDFAGQLQELLCGEFMCTRHLTGLLTEYRSGRCAAGSAAACPPAAQLWRCLLCHGIPSAWHTRQQGRPMPRVSSSSGCRDCEVFVPHADGSPALGLQSS